MWELIALEPEVLRHNRHSRAGGRLFPHLAKIGPDMGHPRSWVGKWVWLFRLISVRGIFSWLRTQVGLFSLNAACNPSLGKSFGPSPCRDTSGCTDLVV